MQNGILGKFIQKSILEGEGHKYSYLFNLIWFWVDQSIPENTISISVLDSLIVSSPSGDTKRFQNSNKRTLILCRNLCTLVYCMTFRRGVCGVSIKPRNDSRFLPSVSKNKRDLFISRNIRSFI